MNPCMLKAENLSAIYSWVSKYSKNFSYCYYLLFWWKIQSFWGICFFLIQFKTDHHIPGYCFAYIYCCCFIFLKCVLFSPFFYCSSTAVIISLPIPPHPTHPHLPPSRLPPLAVSMCPLYMFLANLSSFPPSAPPISPLVTVSLFFIYMSLVVFCLLVCFFD